jgi:RimJ/RimL family protein N-acetyltransferase
MILLRPFENRHIAQLIAWIPDAETLMQFAGPSLGFPLTAEQLESSVDGEKRLSFAIVHAAGGVIGHAAIHFASETTAFLCRILIGDSAQRRKGFGLQAVSQLLALAFNRHGIEQVMLNVFDWNTAAINCYQRAGFSIEEGKSTTRQVNNQAWTVLSMRLPRTIWEDMKR